MASKGGSGGLAPQFRPQRLRGVQGLAPHFTSARRTRGVRGLAPSFVG